MNRFKRILNLFKENCYAWVPIDTPINKPNALFIFYSPNGRYIWGCGMDYKTIKEEYKDVTHYKLVSEEPITPCTRKNHG